MKQIVITLLCFAATAIRAAAQISERDFVNPPRDARPNTYWEWMNGNVNKEGLTRDLEYMKRANYGAAMIFDAGVGIPRGAVDYNSPQWVDAVVHTRKEDKDYSPEYDFHSTFMLPLWAKPETFAAPDRDIIKITTSGLPAPRTEGTVWKDLPDAWTAQFPAWSKAPAEIVLPQLQSLHKHGDFNVKHFSGTATYIKKFTVTKKELKALKNKRLILNLGRVENMAEVSVNDRGFKLIWKAPYQTDITDQLKAGENKLVLKVTNLYPNRMIGDEHLPEKYKYDKYGRLCKFPDWYLKGENIERERVLFSPWKHYHKEEPLLEAGLLGPVRLLIVE